MESYRDEPSNPLCSISESLKYKTSITENTCGVGDGETVYDANKAGKKWNWSCYSSKTFKEFLENFKYIVD